MNYKDILNAIISLIGGIIGGGLTYWRLSVSSSTKQKTKGDYSPNVSGDNNKING